MNKDRKRIRMQVKKIKRLEAELKEAKVATAAAAGDSEEVRRPPKAVLPPRGGEVGAW